MYTLRVSFYEVVLLFWGLPTAILSLGMRRRVPFVSFLAILLTAVGLAGYLALGEGWLLRDASAVIGRFRTVGVVYLAASVLGGLIVLLLRYRKTD